MTRFARAVASVLAIAALGVSTPNVRPPQGGALSSRRTSLVALEQVLGSSGSRIVVASVVARYALKARADRAQLFTLASSTSGLVPERVTHVRHLKPSGRQENAFCSVTRGRAPPRLSSLNS